VPSDKLTGATRSSAPCSADSRNPGSVRSNGCVSVEVGYDGRVRYASTLRGLYAPYLLATGVWSLVHRRSFERVTGPKEDYWLVQAVGA
jgi:hypothetical protein